MSCDTLASAPESASSPFAAPTSRDRFPPPVDDSSVDEGAPVTHGERVSFACHVPECVLCFYMHYTEDLCGSAQGEAEKIRAEVTAILATC